MKVAVFIDNSNVFKNIQRLRKDGDFGWASFYDPLKLAQKLVGNRELAAVYFYCTRPPVYLLNEDEAHQKKHRWTTRYYAEIEKLDKVQVKFGTLSGGKGSIVEKNLDTQLATDIVKGAALGTFDVAILVSNDGDFVSAVTTAREFAKKVEVVFFKDGFSMSLRRVADLTRRARKSFFETLPFEKE